MFVSLTTKIIMSCARLDRDCAIIVQDFGPRGIVSPVVMNLTNGFALGGSVTVVVSTDHEYFIEIVDGKRNKLFHFGARTHKDDLVFNSNLNGAWGLEERPAKNPIQKGVRAVVTIVYEGTGYRVFVNGKEEHFYKHRSTNAPNSLECVSGQFYKVVYMTPVEIIPL